MHGFKHRERLRPFLNVLMTQYVIINQKFKFHSDIDFGSFKIFDFEQGYINYNHQEFVKNSKFPSVELSQNIFYFNALASGKKLKIGSLYQSREFLAGGFYWTPDTHEKKLAVFGFNKLNIYNNNV